MTGRSDSEGLIPVEPLEHHTISPLHISERASTNSTPLSAPISPPPLLTDERTRPEDAPMPVSSPQMHDKEYLGQPPPSEPNPEFAGQHPMNSALEEKAYPGQPVPNYIQPPQPPPQQQPQPYYTPFGQSSSYATAVPLHALRQSPCPVDCPACGQRELTRTEAVSGSTTQ
ncbi:LPS-induced tumor necrosis factor alpha factor [Penicillium sp. IBT 16267x]|nr:LPS-induced tumor necrosis factor alpha factor [Penicillium sp. IBT 16267x]